MNKVPLLLTLLAALLWGCDAAIEDTSATSTPALPAASASLAPGDVPVLNSVQSSGYRLDAETGTVHSLDGKRYAIITSGGTKGAQRHPTDTQRANFPECFERFTRTDDAFRSVGGDRQRQRRPWFPVNVEYGFCSNDLIGYTPDLNGNDGITQQTYRNRYPFDLFDYGENVTVTKVDLVINFSFSPQANRGSKAIVRDLPLSQYGTTPQQQFNAIGNGPALLVANSTSFGDNTYDVTNLLIGQRVKSLIENQTTGNSIIDLHLGLTAQSESSTGLFKAQPSMSLVIQYEQEEVLTAPTPVALTSTSNIPVLFKWSGGEGNPDPTYRLEVFAPSGSRIYDVTVAEKEHRAPANAFTEGQTYTWKVTATNSEGSSSSPTGSFTALPALLPPPSFSISNAYAQGQYPTLVWGSVQGAVGYSMSRQSSLCYDGTNPAVFNLAPNRVNFSASTHTFTDRVGRMDWPLGNTCEVEWLIHSIDQYGRVGGGRLADIQFILTDEIP